jgi:kynurenine formamidase
MADSRRSRWTDLTCPVRAGMPVYPGDPEVEVSRALTYADHGVEVHRVGLGTHTGTHVDAPSHLVPGGRTVDRLEVAELCGPAVVVGVGDLAGDGAITADRLEALLGGRPRPPRRVLLCTAAGPADGPEHERAAPPAPNPPHLTGDAARWLWAAGTRLLGIDTPTPDPPPPAGTELPVHRVFLRQDGIIVENLRGLDRLRPDGSGGRERHVAWTADVEVGVYPLLLAGLDGAPARVVARPLDPGAAGGPAEDMKTREEP